MNWLKSIAAAWCETVHFDKKHCDCYLNIVNGEDKGYNHLAERMKLLAERKITLFDLHVKFKNTMDTLAKKDNNLKRHASNFFKAVFGIPSIAITIKTW